MRGPRLPKLFAALTSLLVLAGALAMAGVAPAGAAPSDRWIEVTWSCCGDQQSAVFMGGAWASGMPVTLEIDHGNNGSIDATQEATSSAACARFDASAGRSSSRRLGTRSFRLPSTTVPSFP